MQLSSSFHSTHKIANRGRAYWQEIIKLLEASEDSPKDFSARMNIKLGTLFHWRNKLKKEKYSQPAKFIELKVKPNKQTVVGLTIECPTGHKIIVASETQLEETKQLFQLLGLIG